MEEQVLVNNSEKPPSKIFVVPYRGRYHQKFFFCKQMDFILHHTKNYLILFSHQCDDRNFNRGAMKNIGFIAMKEKYPNDYKNMTFIFNDVDTLPFSQILDYETEEGVVQHYYGFEEALGGIVVIKGADFEKINGYPNFWGWGMEDACLQKRCNKHQLVIDRSRFYPVGSPEILQLFDGVSRLISKKDHTRMMVDNGRDGIKTIHKLLYTIDNESLNPDDNNHIVYNPRMKYVNITHFQTLVKFQNEDFFEYDLREPKEKIIYSQDAETTAKTMINSSEWRNIPYVPTTEERRRYQQQQQYQQQQYRNQNMQPTLSPSLSPSNIYSAQYARLIGAKPRATASAKIGLGGVR